MPSRSQYSSMGAPHPLRFRTVFQRRLWWGPGRPLRGSGPRGPPMNLGETWAADPPLAAASLGLPSGCWVLDQRRSTSTGAPQRPRFRTMIHRQRRAARDRPLHRPSLRGPPTGPREAGDECVARQGRDVPTATARHPTHRRRRQPRVWKPGKRWTPLQRLPGKRGPSLCRLVNLGLDHLVWLSARARPLEGLRLAMGAKHYLRLACVASAHFECLHSERLM